MVSCRLETINREPETVNRNITTITTGHGIAEQGKTNHL